MAGSKKKNNRLLIHWNGVSTSEFDPRVMVQEFLQNKERQMHVPNVPNAGVNAQKAAQQHLLGLCYLSKVLYCTHIKNFYLKPSLQLSKVAQIEHSVASEDEHLAL